MILRRLFRLISLLSLYLTGCYDNASTPAASNSIPPATTTLGELRRLYAGKTFEVEGDVVVRGYVTSDDRAGNFYRTLTIGDDGAGAEVMAGIDGLHNFYLQGCELTVKLKGLAVGESRGVLQIGRTPAAGSGYATDYIGSRAALDRHLFRRDTLVPIRPTICSILELTPAMAGTLVRIDGLRYAPEKVEESIWSGYKRFTDSEGNAIRTYTRPYAVFADHEIPQCEVLLAGILQYNSDPDGEPDYLLKLRDETDCWY